MVLLILLLALRIFVSRVVPGERRVELAGVPVAIQYRPARKKVAYKEALRPGASLGIRKSIFTPHNGTDMAPHSGLKVDLCQTKTFVNLKIL